MYLYEHHWEKAINELRRMATTDELTGLHNRRQLEKNFTRLASAVDRQYGVLAVIVLVLDQRKQVNDRLGHYAGDKGLVLVARLLRDHLRGSKAATVS